MEPMRDTDQALSLLIAVGSKLSSGINANCLMIEPYANIRVMIQCRASSKTVILLGWERERMLSGKRSVINPTAPLQNFFSVKTSRKIFCRYRRNRLDGVVGLSLAFCAQGFGFDPGQLMARQN
ncbi:hypothetical protein TNCV_1032121 [Trichonephila clavipes]|nr:hypothetical protein TNCV_1032121 [Trichonephila clavipes]